MLYRIQESGYADAFEAVLGSGNPLVLNFCRLSAPLHPEVPRPAVLVDKPADPRIAIICGQDWITGHASDKSLWLPAMRSILLGEGEFPKDFPSRGVWQPREAPDGVAPGTPYMFISQTEVAAAVAAREAGFQIDRPGFDFVHGAELWYFKGEPRFSDRVKHECRLGNGLELLEKLRETWPYGDKEGKYIKHCLESGPSFVCEHGGEQVSWSATHLSRTMAMIHTPEHLRGKGYASSLAAFQVDHMLAVDGQATAHIWHENHPSQALLRKLGANKLEGYFCWILAYFPEYRWTPLR
ncbi:MAG: hypothetical protein HRF49_11055 [bacterium]